MKKQFIILIFCLLIHTTFACINEYKTLLDGSIYESGEPSSGKIGVNSIKNSELGEKAEALLKAYQRSDSIEYLSDYGAALVYMGQYEEGQKIYQQIEAENPGLYTTASNLGTIYELLGDPEKALYWIKKSVEINPQSHQGSEWIHIKILEFKLSEKKDYNQSILGMDFGNEEIPSKPENADLRKLQDHIYHQLSERLKFISPPNQIVGNIYFDYGNSIAHTIDVETALEAYEEAKRFGLKSELLEKRIAKFMELSKKAEFMNKPVTEKISSSDYWFYVFQHFLLTGLICGLVFGGILFWIVKMKQKRS